jgi:putative endonuclease
MGRTYYVYILASRSRNLYTGVTGNLQRRMVEHREGLVPGFTSRYRVFRLVHLETFADIRYAIAREKEIKAWRREKRIRLIERDNPTWTDADWLGPPPRAIPTAESQSAASENTGEMAEERPAEEAQDNATADPSHAAKCRPGSG